MTSKPSPSTSLRFFSPARPTLFGGVVSYPLYHLVLKQSSIYLLWAVHESRLRSDAVVFPVSAPLFACLGRRRPSTLAVSSAPSVAPLRGRAFDLLFSRSGVATCAESLSGGFSSRLVTIPRLATATKMLLLRALVALVLAAAGAPALRDEADYTPIVRPSASPPTLERADRLRMMRTGRPTGSAVTLPRSVPDWAAGQEPRDDGPACSSYRVHSQRTEPADMLIRSSGRRCRSAGRACSGWTARRGTGWAT